MRCFFLFLYILIINGMAQAQDERRPELKAKAERAIGDLRDSGLVVVRLKTELRPIQVLEAVLARTTLKPKQRERHQAILNGTIKERDEANHAMIAAFIDSFDFCPVYFIYDTSARTLYNGAYSNILWEWKAGKLERCTTPLPASRPHLFTAYYRDASGEFPYDAIALRRVREELHDPFPFEAAVRSSFVNESKAKQIIRAIRILNTRLKKYYQQVRGTGGN